MIIACPACSTRYVVPDTAIGVDGRTVRCAKCRHSWFQHGPELPARAEPAVAAAAAPFHAPAPPPQTAERPAPVPAAPFVDPSSEPAVDENAAESVPEPPAVPRPVTRGSDAAYAEAGSRFEHEPPFRPRRNMAKLWTLTGAGFAVLVALLIGLSMWFGLPRWLSSAQATFGAGRPDLVLSFPPERQDRRTLPNGTEYFGASGTVTNVGKDPHEVPPILIVLRDAKDKVVYTWNVTPPRDSLKPGESVTINEAVTDVPKSAKVAEIGWKPD
jgi:hypothetical protein